MTRRKTITARTITALLACGAVIAAGWGFSSGISRAAQARGKPPELEQLHRWILALDAVSQGDEEAMRSCKVSGEQAKLMLASLQPLWEEGIGKRAARAKRLQAKQWSRSCQKDPCVCPIYAPVSQKMLEVRGWGEPNELEKKLQEGAAGLGPEARLACARKYAKGGACRSPAFKRRLAASRSLDAPAAH